MEKCGSDKMLQSVHASKQWQDIQTFTVSQTIGYSLISNRIVAYPDS